LLSLCGCLPLWPDVIATVQRLASEHPTPSFWAVETNTESCEKAHGYVAMEIKSLRYSVTARHVIQLVSNQEDISEKRVWKDIKRRKVKGDSSFKR
jgi:hypothetical protein